MSREPVGRVCGQETGREWILVEWPMGLAATGEAKGPTGKGQEAWGKPSGAVKESQKAPFFLQQFALCRLLSLATPCPFVNRIHCCLLGFRKSCLRECEMEILLLTFLAGMGTPGRRATCFFLVILAEGSV